MKVNQKTNNLQTILAAIKKIREDKQLPWLELDKAGMVGTLMNIPARADIPLEINESLIVELYSK